MDQLSLIRGLNYDPHLSHPQGLARHLARFHRTFLLPLAKVGEEVD